MYGLLRHVLFDGVGRDRAGGKRGGHGVHSGVPFLKEERK
jgi:hypothetical protein